MLLPFYANCIQCKHFKPLIEATTKINKTVSKHHGSATNEQHNARFFPHVPMPLIINACIFVPTQ